MVGTARIALPRPCFSGRFDFQRHDEVEELHSDSCKHCSKTMSLSALDSFHWSGEVPGGLFLAGSKGFVGGLGKTVWGFMGVFRLYPAAIRDAE